TSVGVLMNPVIALIARGPRALAAARQADLDALAADELIELNRIAQDIVREAQALSLATLSAAQRKEAHRSAGATSMGAVLATQAGISRREAHQRVRLAEKLEVAAVTREALSRPGMSHHKAQILTDALDALPAGLTHGEKTTVERAL